MVEIHPKYYVIWSNIIWDIINNTSIKKITNLLLNHSELFVPQMVQS